MAGSMSLPVVTACSDPPHIDTKSGTIFATFLSFSRIQHHPLDAMMHLGAEYF
jgi:hypothetical protein